MEAFPGELLGQDRQVGRDLGGGQEPVEGVEDEPFDGLGPERSGELAARVACVTERTRCCWSRGRSLRLSVMRSSVQASALAAGRSSSIRARTRRSISSRIGPDGVDALAGGVVELPVLVALARVDRALVAAAHGDDDVGGLDGGVVELLRVGAGGAQVDAELGHGLDDGRVDVVGRGGAGGADDDPVTGVVGEQRGGHLGAAGVVDADEQHLGASVSHRGSPNGCGGRRGGRARRRSPRR